MKRIAVITPLFLRRSCSEFVSIAPYRVPCWSKMGSDGDLAGDVRDDGKNPVHRFVGLRCPAWLRLGGQRSRDYLPARATLNAQGTRDVARLTLTFYAVVCARPPLLAPQPPRSRGKTRGRKKNAWQCAKQVFHTYSYIHINIPGTRYIYQVRVFDARYQLWSEI